MTVITHAYTPLMDVDSMSEEDCRLALKDVLRDGFAKDQQMVELKTINHTLNQQLNHANNILIKLAELKLAYQHEAYEAELEQLAAYYLHLKAEQQTAGRVH
ncbi:TPA: hypothetical protein ACHTJ0_006244 [Pseudomonas aeruginosa]|uniref:Uncharacterized protein n=3 Tax=root TaxID=1 RepID=A0A5A4N1D4_9CAUD|nr:MULTISPECIES: hypothetical protein [Pseudomonas]YP_010773895.1 hypothetical protein QJS21_gp09 [Pseudomonas phage Ps60]KFF32044.1 hypothetical protein G039_0330660 [Pseudomonas aeruginosa VRFPA01]ARG85409.1 hypothetical protein E613_12910 [Pseudomonas aeruginosa]AUA76455.1 hypothetical protein CWI21_10065 [Pseudomonas aeruginosa]AUB01080.1 hypothetical protein CWI20_10065 [Pseudomonas aeruginosa]AVJ96400.1 hypothetical protein CSB94_1179 [Pseudomonas aeruginosa]